MRTHVTRQPPKRKSGIGCLIGAVIGLSALLFIGGILLVVILAIAGGSPGKGGGPVGMGGDAFPNMREVWAYGDGETKVALIPLRGMIQMEETAGFFGPGGTSSELALRAIRRATADTEVKAIILDIDSGGGGITASDILYKALIDFKDAQPGRKVVSIYGDVAASGAYYISLASDHILGRPTSITGSIGVLMPAVNISGLGEKIGVKDTTITSVDNKVLFNPLRERTPVQKQILQNIVNEMHTRFVELVAHHRKMSTTEARRLADGRIFTAQQAAKLRLIDSVGYWGNALAITAHVLDVDDIKVYRYEEEFSFSSLFRASQALNPEVLVERLTRRGRLMYLWNP